MDRVGVSWRALLTTLRDRFGIEWVTGDDEERETSCPTRAGTAFFVGRRAATFFSRVVGESSGIYGIYDDSRRGLRREAEKNGRGNPDLDMSHIGALASDVPA